MGSSQSAIRFLIPWITILLVLMSGLFTCNSSGDGRPDRVWPEIRLNFFLGNIRQPTSITHAADGSDRLFITEQRGRILLVKSGAVSRQPFLDISGNVSCCGERGLLSAAFPPGYMEKRYFYVNYTNISGDTVVARYRTTQNPDRADPNSEEIILTVKQPYSNHNGGQIAFGPDGYLYIGMGDGGAAGDPHLHAQNASSLLGKMLRIRVESVPKPYAIPSDNPYVSHRTYRPEIWATGLRNPWRFSFDRISGDLYIADVGQNTYEEIHVQPKGVQGSRNYGWNIMEGLACYASDNCNRNGLALPVAVYDHNQGCSITGGMVYRGSAYASMQGIYLYGDFCSGRIWGLKKSTGEWTTMELKNTGMAISTFGEDEAGEIYAADYGKGAIYRIEAVQR